ncbi:Panacea domain-containing protein [Clostridium thermobutyricum]
MYSAQEIAKWFLIKDRTVNKELEISNLKLQKLLYYAQGVYLAVTEKPLFKDDIEAWQHGPVIKEVYYKYCENGRNIIDYNPEEEDRDIIKRIEHDEKARDILEFVAEEFGQYTAWKLRDMTHEERPWLETRRNSIIKNDLIRDYFISEIIEVN